MKIFDAKFMRVSSRDIFPLSCITVEITCCKTITTETCLLRHSFILIIGFHNIFQSGGQSVHTRFQGMAEYRTNITLLIIIAMFLNMCSQMAGCVLF